MMGCRVQVEELSCTCTLELNRIKGSVVAVDLLAELQACGGMHASGAAAAAAAARTITMQLPQPRLLMKSQRAGAYMHAISNPTAPQLYTWYEPA
jgi:NAD(P)H-hydrate repair Nnr-like enzyme with NAD(P)H-hydrate epimerase domain